MTTLTTEEADNIATIDAFIAAWNAKDGAKAVSYLANDFRFTFGKIGHAPEFTQPDFAAMMELATSVDMAVTPGMTWARGPVVSHERVDDIQFRDGTKAEGKFIAVFTLRNGRIVDCIDFEI